MKPLYQEQFFFFFFFFIVFLGGTINAACDRNLCKLFTIKKNQGKKKKVVDVFPKKSLSFFLYVTDFCNMGCHLS